MPNPDLTQWRMVRAAAMLRRHLPVTMLSVATAVGYESESSFGKAFKRVMGTSPGEYRQRHGRDRKARAETSS